MDSYDGNMLKRINVFGKEFHVCTIAGYVAYIDKFEYNNYENDSLSSIRAVKTKIFVRHNAFDIHEYFAINNRFNGNVGDKIVITCIKNKKNEKTNITLVNIDSGQSIMLSNVNNFICLIGEVEKLKTILLEWLLGCSLAIFFYHSLCMDESYKIKGTVASYCIAVIFYFAMSFFLKMNAKKKRLIYTSSIQKNIEAVSEQINCPIRFKFSGTK